MRIRSGSGEAFDWFVSAGFLRQHRGPGPPHSSGKARSRCTEILQKAPAGKCLGGELHYGPPVAATIIKPARSVKSQHSLRLITETLKWGRTERRGTADLRHSIAVLLTRKSIPAPPGILTSPLSELKTITPVAPVRPALTMRTCSSPYVPHASEEKTQSACGASLPSVAPLHFVASLALTWARTPPVTAFPTTSFESLWVVTGPPSP